MQKTPQLTLAIALGAAVVLGVGSLFFFKFTTRGLGVQPAVSPIDSATSAFPAAGTSSEALKELKVFPPAEKGFRRHVILLAPLEIEGNAKVEVRVGKMVPYDCAGQGFDGTLEEKFVQGWGYGFYVLREVRGPFSSGALIGCLPTNRKEFEFVYVRGSTREFGGFLWGYNSRLPLVIHAPDGFEVRYRLWRADDVHRNARVQ